jgi:hypothetical protein
MEILRGILLVPAVELEVVVPVHIIISPLPVGEALVQTEQGQLLVLLAQAMEEAEVLEEAREKTVEQVGEATLARAVFMGEAEEALQVLALVVALVMVNRVV